MLELVLLPDPNTHLRNFSAARRSQELNLFLQSGKPRLLQYQGLSFTGLPGISHSAEILRDQGLSWSAVCLGTTLSVCLAASLLSNDSL